MTQARTDPARPYPTQTHSDFRALRTLPRTTPIFALSAPRPGFAGTLPRLLRHRDSNAGRRVRAASAGCRPSATFAAPAVRPEGDAILIEAARTAACLYPDNIPADCDISKRPRSSGGKGEAGGSGSRKLVGARLVIGDANTGRLPRDPMGVMMI